MGYDVHEDDDDEDEQEEDSDEEDGNREQEDEEEKHKEEKRLEEYSELKDAIDGGPTNPVLLKSFRGHVAYYIWHGQGPLYLWIRQIIPMRLISPKTCYRGPENNKYKCNRDENLRSWETWQHHCIRVGEVGAYRANFATERLQHIGARLYPLHPEVRHRTDDVTLWQCINDVTQQVEDWMSRLQEERQRRRLGGFSRMGGHISGHGL
ncbi:Heat shock 70 kDa protein 4 [Bienertia sinuspersici]